MCVCVCGLSLTVCLVYFLRVTLAPCGLRGCENRPTPIPGQMYKATKPGLVLFYILACFIVAVLLWPLLCIVYIRLYVFCLLVVLVKFQYLPSD